MCCALMCAGGADPGGRPPAHAGPAKVIRGGGLSTGARASNNTQHVNNGIDYPYCVMVNKG